MIMDHNLWCIKNKQVWRNKNKPVGDLEGLSKLNKIVTEKLLEIIPRDHIIINESYSPHLTIFKPNRKVKGPKMSLFGPIEEMDFGSELFDRMELCSMLKPKRPDGSYFVEHEGNLT